jgi:hypothetical protein
LQSDDVESAKRSDATIFVVPSPILEGNEVAVIQVIRHAVYAEAKEVA